ncbi:hypothetical protein ADK66_24220 [Micromonospora sp. NRRL B-16802]|uniref:GNAT family N-acetyltransferase n=1 Tax=Micromonospora sp. NRRL B-16802 TaxID=1415541 RepID=UPI0006AFBF6B|nr:GNAT family N-acetyltransferase [Micromonospora sp. NRRL B-16802]KOX05609.1 hypothetical protein ADK66_24220 [Micromonospora sp. NRRL B-16802]
MTTDQLAPATTTTSLADLPPSVWALIRTSQDLYLHERWLRVEQDAHPNASFHAWTQDEGHAAYAPAYRFDADDNPWAASRLDLFLAAHADLETGPAVLPNYLLGGRRPGHSQILCDAPAPRRRTLLTQVVGAAAQAAAAAGAATLAALYCDRDDEDLAAAFRAHGAVRLPSPGLNVLHLPGTSFDDWLASMPNRRRTNVNAERRKLAHAGVTIELRPLTSDDLDEILPLELDQYEKYGHHYRHTEARALHEAYLRHLGEDALLVRAHLDGRLVAFASIVRHGRSAYIRQGGFDAVASDGAPVYFGTVFHQPIAWAYRVGVDSIDLSISADATKQHRRAVTRPRDAWVVPMTDEAERALRRWPGMEQVQR